MTESRSEITHRLFTDIRRMFNDGACMDDIARALAPTIRAMYPHPLVKPTEFVWTFLENCGVIRCPGEAINRERPKPWHQLTLKHWHNNPIYADLGIPEHTVKRQHEYEWCQACKRAQRAGLTSRQIADWFGCDMYYVRRALSLTWRAFSNAPELAPVAAWMNRKISRHDINQIVRLRRFGHDIRNVQFHRTLNGSTVNENAQT